VNSSSDQRAGALSGTDGAAVGAGLAEQRQTIAQRLLDGTSGGEIVIAQTDFVDADYRPVSQRCASVAMP
jgi:hypothetical protein